MSTTINDNDPTLVAAAILIQRLWRKKMAEQRWKEAVIQTNFKLLRSSAQEGRNHPSTRWKRAVFILSRLQDRNRKLESDSAKEKQLETQHWLELVDGKHRYGSNLKWYHRRWEQEDTTENFFQWLDKGGGKDLSLDQCPRSQLNKEKIKYLSTEQRLNYLVRINSDGRLIWAKNNQLVDTTPGHWKDASDYAGIVPQDPPHEHHSGLSSSSKQENAATHYASAEQTSGKHQWTRYIRRYVTLRGMMERLLRRTVRRNTWIYVSDRNFNIYIGIKETGTFQHSSFIAGGPVTSAGIISVKRGLIHTLSPLSGHYRTSIDHFHRFIDVLTERGVDMHKARISKAEVALWGIEHITKIKKARARGTKAAQSYIQHVATKAKSSWRQKPPENEWKQAILHGRGNSRRVDDQPEMPPFET